MITSRRIPGPDLVALTPGPNGTLWFTAVGEHLVYPGNGRIGRVTIAALGPGRTLPPASATDEPGPRKP